MTQENRDFTLVSERGTARNKMGTRMKTDHLWEAVQGQSRTFFRACVNGLEKANLSASAWRNCMLMMLFVSA